MQRTHFLMRNNDIQYNLTEDLGFPHIFWGSPQVWMINVLISIFSSCNGVFDAFNTP